MKIDMKKGCNKCDNNGRNDENKSSLRRGSSTKTGWSAQLGNRSQPLSVIGANENHSYNKLTSLRIKIIHIINMLDQG